MRTSNWTGPVAGPEAPAPSAGLALRELSPRAVALKVREQAAGRGASYALLEPEEWAVVLRALGRMPEPHPPCAQCGRANQASCWYADCPRHERRL